MSLFKRYLTEAAGPLSSADREDVEIQLSNWTYLHLSFMDKEPTQKELETMMLVEIESRNRAQILRRLYSRWQRALREAHHRELGI